MLVVASDPFAISTMAHALYDILPFLYKTRASSFFALSSLSYRRLQFAQASKLSSTHCLQITHADHPSLE